MDVKALEQGGFGSKSINHEASSRRQVVVPSLKLQSPTTSYDARPVNHEASPRQHEVEVIPTLALQSPGSSTRIKTGLTENLTDGQQLDRSQVAPPSGSSASFKSDSDHSSISEPVIVPMGDKSLPMPKQRTLPPLSPQQRTSLPPIQTNKGKAPTVSVSELLSGSENQGFIPGKSESAESSSDESNRRYTGADDSPRFNRPTLLEKKKDELFSSKSVELEAKSPNRNARFEENDGFNEILQNIDLRSSRSMEDGMDPKLTDLLNKLEPAPSLTKATEPNQGIVTSPTRSLRHDQYSVTSPTSSLNHSRGIVTPPKTKDQVVEVKDDPSSQSGFSEKKVSDKRSKDDDYSDEFASSASEVKTMSDFEQSTTSIPRIEEKVHSYLCQNRILVLSQ